MSKPPGPMVEVHWVDPGGMNGWMQPMETEGVWGILLEGVRSVGFAIEDNPRGVLMVSGYSSDGRYLDSHHIPRRSIISVRRLRR